MLTNDRLWVGTGNGVVLSVPLVAARPARDDGEAPTSSPGTGGTGGPGGAVRVYSNEGKDGDAPRGSSFMPYCSMVSNEYGNILMQCFSIAILIAEKHHVTIQIRVVTVITDRRCFNCRVSFMGVSNTTRELKLPHCFVESYWRVGEVSTISPLRSVNSRELLDQG